MNDFKITKEFEKHNTTDKNHLFLSQIKSTIENNGSDGSFNYDTFALKLRVSRSTLHRKVNKLTGLTPRELISSYRMKLALQMLSDKSYNISEVAYKLGFNDPKYFSRCFKNQSGLNPREYRESMREKKGEVFCSNHDISFIQKAKAGIEKNIMQQNFSIDQFAFDMSVSKSTLYRKLKEVTGLSPNEFIRSVRINHSTKLFTASSQIQDIGFAVGFDDSKYYSRCFKKELGLTPTQYKIMLNKNSNSKPEFTLNNQFTWAEAK